jgi:hypothetical protein
MIFSLHNAKMLNETALEMRRLYKQESAAGLNTQFVKTIRENIDTNKNGTIDNFSKDNGELSNLADYANRFALGLISKELGFDIITNNKDGKFSLNSKPIHSDTISISQLPNHANKELFAEIANRINPDNVISRSELSDYLLKESVLPLFATYSRLSAAVSYVYLNSPPKKEDEWAWVHSLKLSGSIASASIKTVWDMSMGTLFGKQSITDIAEHYSIGSDIFFHQSWWLLQSSNFNNSSSLEKWLNSAK